MRLSGLFNQIQQTKVLVIGDLMLDTYTTGKARRISPEAPVAIVHVKNTEERAGGAGNVALNLLSLGSDVSIIGRIGQDMSGRILLHSLGDKGINTGGVVTDENFVTPVKNRVIADNQQMVRIDYEEVIDLAESLEAEVISSLPFLIKGTDVIAISDYGKGFLTPNLIQAVIACAKEEEVPIIVDPKGLDFTRYKGADVIKPNTSEAIAASGLGREATLEEVAHQILFQTESKTLLLTRSEDGISLFEPDRREDFSVDVQEIKDVTGAGDTVLATIAWAMANKLSLADACRLSNLAAGISLAHIGCAPVTLADLAHRALETDTVQKVFEEEHIFALQKLLAGQKCTLLGIHESNGIETSLFLTLRKLSIDPKTQLIVYIRDKEPSEDFVTHLASLREVDFIILKNESLRKLCDGIHPQETFIYEKGALSPLEAPTPLLV